MKTRVFFMLLGCVLVFSACSSGDETPPPVDTSRAQFSVYDDFSDCGFQACGIRFNGAKWLSGEAQTYVAGGGYLFKSTGVNPILANTNFTDTLVAVAPSPTSIEAKMNMVQSSFDVFNTSFPESRSMVELQYQPLQYRQISAQDFFYARGEMRDVLSGQRQIRLFVQGCSNAACTTFHQILGGNFAVVTAVDPFVIGTDYVLLLSWDGTSFNLTVTDTAATPNVLGTASVNMTGVTNFSAADSYRAVLRTRVRGGTNNSSYASQYTYFDDVWINGALHDDFATGVDTTKWEQGDHARFYQLTRDVKFTQSQSLRSRSNNLEFRNPGSVNAIRADVTVPSADWVVTNSDTDSYQRGRLGGFFYNDGTITVGAETGSRISDIFAEIGMTDASVYYMVMRCTNVDCSAADNLSGVPLDPKVTVGSIVADSTNKLSIDWDGALFHFQLNSDVEMTFDPVVAGAPVAQAFPNESLKVIGTRISMGAAALHDGSLSATFDNVETRP